MDYRFSKWIKIISERNESGLSIQKYCENQGLRESSYYYWLKKLRDTASEKLSELQPNTLAVQTPVFTKINMETSPPECKVPQNQVSIETNGLRITAGNGYPVVNLIELLQGVNRVCF